MLFGQNRRHRLSETSQQIRGSIGKDQSEIFTRSNLSFRSDLKSSRLQPRGKVRSRPDTLLTGHLASQEQRLTASRWVAAAIG